MEQIDTDKEIKEASTDKDLVITIDRLISATEKLTIVQKKIERQNRIGFILLKSIAYALGSTLGLAIVISIILFILKSIGVFDNLTPLLDGLKDLKTLTQ